MQTPTQPPIQTPVPRLRDTAFPLLWLNVFSYMLIASAERFTFVWLVIEELDGPAWASGMVLFTLGLPVFVFVLPGGALADRLDRRRLLMTTQVAGAVVTGVAAILSQTGTMNLALAMVTAAALGTAIAFGQPVRGSLVPSVVPQELLLRAVVTITIGMNVAMIAGPFLAGMIIREVGVGLAFAVEAVLFAIGYATLIPLKLPARDVVSEGRVRLHELRASIAIGLRFVWHHPTLRPLFSMLMVGGFFMMGASSLLVPEIAHDEFGSEADEAARLFAGMGAGMMVTSLVLLRKGALRRKGLLFLIAMVVGTTLQLLMGFAPTYAALAVLLCCWGASGGFYLNLNQTLIQSATPQETMGRIMSLHTLAQAGLAPIGSLLAGLIASGLGPRAAMSIYGGAGILLAAFTLVRARPLRALP